MNIYGATLRVWDPSIQAWRITWINPVGNHREEQEAPLPGEKVIRFAQILVSGTGASVPGMVDLVGSSTTGGSNAPGACWATANCQ